MSSRIVESVPNFSEGRDQKTIDLIVDSFKEVSGCILMDYRADKDHNRLVVTIVGDPEPVQEALIDASKKAVERIDLEKHTGCHPRIGAVDVIPFVPISGISMEDCVTLARDFGKRFNKETGVPVYYYEEAALRDDRKGLEKIRRGQFEVLKNEICLPERHPDVGEPVIHKSAGATVIGARKFLIAFNVNLKTADVKVADKIAQNVRASSGGLCHVKGMGLLLKEKGMTQVSMNIVDYEKNALYRIVELIRMEAKRWGVDIYETEIYGMIPARALLDSAAYYMQLNGFDAKQVVELAMLEMMSKE